MGGDSNQLLQCYNKGCGQKFNPSENGDESCLFHPGPPYFHDAYKIWQCCDKKSTDFGTWLSIKGCTRGPHNEVKPEDVVRVAAVKEIRPEKEDEVIVWNGLNKPAERRARATDLIQLVVDLTPGAQKALQLAAASALSNADETQPVQVGAACKNLGCSKTYQGTSTDVEECVYHPGAAIFHEGMKFYSCCNKKTSSFTDFLAQVGCSKGKHVWSKNERVDKIREDWFASNGFVHINIYCKGADPTNLIARTDGLTLHVDVQHGNGSKQSTFTYELFDEIDPAQSKVTVGERKVEVQLRQQSVVSWPRLRYEPPSAETGEEKGE